MSVNNKKSIDSAVLAAVITVIGGIIIALIPTLTNRPAAVEPTPVPPTAVVFTETVAPTVLPTDTVPAGDSTSTPEPPTSTPEPLPTPTLIPAGADWPQDCISAVWVPYPSSISAESDDKGCLVRPVGKFYTTDGNLAFSFEERVSSSQLYGLFTKLPSEGTVRVDLRPLTLRRGEVVIGIFASPDVNSQGVIISLPASNDLAKRQKFYMKTMPNQVGFAESVELSADPPLYDARFDFDGGSISVILFKDQVELGTVPVLSGEKWLFLGYQAVNGGTNTLQAEFQNLVIEPR